MKTSTSPIDQKVYSLPEVKDDSKNIDSFLQDRGEREIIAIQGLGFVGSAMAMVVAKNHGQFKVLGVDLPTQDHYWKIASFNEGQVPIESSDPKVKEYAHISSSNGSFYATFDPYAYAKADIIIIDINLDVGKTHDQDNLLLDYEVNLTPFQKAIKTIGKYCKSRRDNFVRINGSTWNDN